MLFIKQHVKGADGLLPFFCARWIDYDGGLDDEEQFDGDADGL